MRRFWLNPNIVGNGILWIVGAAMQIGGWVNQTIAIVLLVVAFIWSMVLLVYRLANKQKKQNNEPVKNALKIGAKVKEIKTAGYYDKAFGGQPEGDKRISIEVILAPSKPTTVNILALNLWGKNYEAKLYRETPPFFDITQLVPLTITDSRTYTLIFDVPKESAIDTKEARIYSFANGVEFYSEPFQIDFGDTK